jgi:hypothetical protein
MRRFKLYVSGVAVIAALIIVALPAAGALAAPKLLKLSKEGVEAPNGSTAYAELAVAGCTVVSEGTLSGNDSKKVLVSSASDLIAECEEEGASVSGVMTTVQMGGTGKTTMKGKIYVTKPGPCQYKFTKWKGQFEMPGYSSIEGTSVGKLNKKGSLPTGCAATEEEFFAGAAADDELGPFEASLG